MSDFMYTTNSLIQKVTEDLLRQKENLLMEQLNDFISRGLIEIQETQPVIVKEVNLLEPDGFKLTLRQSVRLVLKDKEYIKKLEEENKDLKEKLDIINEALKDLK